MRGAAIVLLLAAGCALEPRQSAVYVGDGDLMPLFYAVLQGPGLGPTDFEPTELDFTAGATNEPKLPPIQPDANEAWLLGWVERPASDGDAIRIALKEDRRLPAANFASLGTVEGSVIRFPKGVSNIPPVALVDNDRCQSIETPTVKTIDCDARCNVSVVRDRCRLDVVFDDCSLGTASFRLGEQVESIEESMTEDCSVNSRTSPGVTRFFCGSDCNIHIIEPEVEDWLQSTEEIITTSSTLTLELSDFGDGPFPGLTIVDERLLVPVYAGNWPTQCELDPEAPTTVWMSSLDFSQTVTTTTGSCAGVSRAHDDGSQLWWGYQTNGLFVPPPEKEAFVGLFNSTRSTNWPTQLDNFSFADLETDFVPLRIETKRQTAWVLAAMADDHRGIAESALYEVTAQNESLIATQIGIAEPGEDFHDLAVDPDSDRAFALAVNNEDKSIIYALRGDDVVMKDPCNELDSPPYRFKMIEGRLFGYAGADGALYITRLIPTDDTLEATCQRLTLISQWGPVVEVAQWTPGVALIAQLDAQGVLRVQRISLENDEPVWPSLELGRGPLIDLTPGPGGQVFGLLPQQGSVVRLAPSD